MFYFFFFGRFVSPKKTLTFKRLQSNFTQLTKGSTTHRSRSSPQLLLMSKSDGCVLGRLIKAAGSARLMCASGGGGSLLKDAG